MAILVLGLLIIVSGIYHYAPIRSKLYPKFTFVTPGSILTTLLIISTTLILQYYINNIVAYNTIYGSIGAVIAFLLLLYFNANCILIGFELNRSIGMAQNSRLESRPHIIKKINDINM
jgi:membrane protein